jgi:hypothetical protein
VITVWSENDLDLQHFRALPRVVCEGFSVWPAAKSGTLWRDGRYRLGRIKRKRSERNDEGGLMLTTILIILLIVILLGGGGGYYGYRGYGGPGLGGVLGLVIVVLLVLWLLGLLLGGVSHTPA